MVKQFIQLGHYGDGCVPRLHNRASTVPAGTYAMLLSLCRPVNDRRLFKCRMEEENLHDLQLEEDSSPVASFRTGEDRYLNVCTSTYSIDISLLRQIIKHFSSSTVLINPSQRILVGWFNVGVNILVVNTNSNTYSYTKSNTNSNTNSNTHSNTIINTGLTGATQQQQQ